MDGSTMRERIPAMMLIMKAMRDVDFKPPRLLVGVPCLQSFGARSPSPLCFLTHTIINIHIMSAVSSKTQSGAGDFD